MDLKVAKILFVPYLFLKRLRLRLRVDLLFSYSDTQISGSTLQRLNSKCVFAAAEGRSELDELQEEVARKAREQELQRRQEKEKEAAMGFNPKPSKFMDLDELQNQGQSLPVLNYKEQRSQGHFWGFAAAWGCMWECVWV